VGYNYFTTMESEMAKRKTLIVSSQEVKKDPSVLPQEVPSEPVAHRIISPTLLANIRTEALKTHIDTAHIIADLEAWRKEIEATIAFLKARDK